MTFLFLCLLIAGQQIPTSESGWHQYVNDKFDQIKDQHSELVSKLEHLDNNINANAGRIENIATKQAVVISRLDTLSTAAWVMISALVVLVINEIGKHIFRRKT